MFINNIVVLKNKKEYLPNRKSKLIYNMYFLIYRFMISIHCYFTKLIHIKFITNGLKNLSIKRVLKHCTYSIAGIIPSL